MKNTKKLKGKIPAWMNKTNHCRICNVIVPVNYAICKKCNKKQIYRDTDIEWEKIIPSYPIANIKGRKYIPSPSLKKSKPTYPKYIFTPDKELISFANEFSKNYKKVKSGMYVSKTEKYYIWYRDKILSLAGRELNTPVRISSQRKIIEINRNKILKNKNYSADFIFLLILWSIAIIENPTHDFIDADTDAIRYYLTTKRTRKNILKGYLEMFKLNPTEINKKRLINIKKSFTP